MTLTELQEKLNNLREDLTMFDLVLRQKSEDGEPNIAEGDYYITRKQSKLVRKLFEIFRSLNFSLAFGSHKSLVKEPYEPINLRRCGTPVKVRSCVKEHGTDTHFGILLGEVPTTMMHKADKDGTVTASMAMYNPAIYVPALKTVVYGYQSWWGEIESEEELAELITNDTINNVWYMQHLIAHAKTPTNEPAQEQTDKPLAS